MRRPTPPQTVGPFFHPALLRRPMNVLVPEAMEGSRVRIEGRVLDGDGAAVDDALVEIWHAGPDGRYPEPGASEPYGFGRSGTDREGCFWFETVKPGVIRGTRMQAPHVNVHVFARGLLDRLATRMYFADEPGNDDDPILTVVPSDRRATLIADRVDGAIPTYRFDIVLQGERETVFFDA